ncbi:MAG: hypothetical protein ACM3TR_09955 [Caulobacteraceae bacterium]
MDKAYLDLYEGIWKQALEDDIKAQRARLFFDITENVFSELLASEKETRDTFSKISNKLPQKSSSVIRLEQLFDESKKQLINAVKNKIHREAEKWPNNTRCKDTEYEKEYRKLRDSIINAFNAVAKEAVG